MSLVALATSTPVPHANARLVDASALQHELESQIEGEVRFDAVSRALYSTDASVYKIEPLGVVVAKSREDLIRIVRIASRFRCPITLRGGGTAQAGQAIGAGLQVDTSKYYNQILELNVDERWVRVQPGIVLDELNAALRPHGLRFAPDVSTASRASIGGMMGNNSSGARSVLYGKTVDHVLEQEVVLADSSIARFRPLRQRGACGRYAGRDARGRVLPDRPSFGHGMRGRSGSQISQGAASRRRLQSRRIHFP